MYKGEEGNGSEVCIAGGGEVYVGAFGRREAYGTKVSKGAFGASEVYREVGRVGGGKAC
jgi:hypothetical protein